MDSSGRDISAEASRSSPAPREDAHITRALRAGTKLPQGDTGTMSDSATAPAVPEEDSASALSLASVTALTRS